MSPENIKKLEKYRYVLEGKSFTRVPGYDLNEVLEVIRAEFNPSYTVDMFCNHCKMRMIEYAFNEMNKRK